MMVQSIFDNHSQTKRIWGRFILSQLGEIYDIDSAVRVMGDSFIQETFSVPVLVPDPLNPQGQGQPQMGPDGKLVMEVDVQAVAKSFNTVLSDAGFGIYDVCKGFWDFRVWAEA